MIVTRQIQMHPDSNSPVVVENNGRTAWMKITIAEWETVTVFLTAEQLYALANQAEHIANVVSCSSQEPTNA